MVSPYYSTSTKAQASVAEHYRLTGPSFLRNRTLPDIAPCGAPGTRHGGPVGSQQPAKWGDSLRHLHPSKADTGLARSDGDDRAQDGRGRQSERGRYRSATGPTPLGCANRYRSATEPLPIRYRSRARPEHASRARPDHFYQQSCRQIGYRSQLSTAWNCAETPRTPRKSATEPLPFRYPSQSRPRLLGLLRVDKRW